jgi:hypothetical protein
VEDRVVRGAFPAAPAVTRRRGVARALTRADIPAVASMFGRVFRDSAGERALALGRDLEQVFLAHPYYEPATGSLVMERHDGQLGGFLGIIPIPVVFDGASLRGSVMSTWMIRDPSQDRGAGVALIRAHLGRPGALSFVDTANSRSLSFARSLDMTVLTSHSLQWAKPLNYSGYLMLRAAGSIGLNGAALARWIQRPEALSRARPNAPSASRAVTPETFAEHFLRFARESRLRPDWTPEAIVWMLSVATRGGALGALKLREVFDEKGAVVGCHAFHATPGGRAVALQWLALETHEARVLKDFIAQARAESCVIAGGPSDPRLLRALFGLPNVFYRHTCATAVNSRMPEITAALLAGQGLIGGLMGDRWTPLSTET